jgi:hypothetical protein
MPVTAIDNTSLLLNFTNTGIVDNSTNNTLVTVGTAQISTAVKKYGAGSMYFPSSDTGSLAHALSIPADSINDIGAGDFTIECWVYATSIQNYSRLINFNATWNAAGATSILFLTDRQKIGFSAYDIANPMLQANDTYQLNRWYHIAVTRSGNNFSLFIDGIKQTSTYTTSSRLWATTTPYITIGNGPDSQGGFSPMTGYIDDLRITRGLARYTSNFTPPNSLPGK